MPALKDKTTNGKPSTGQPLLFSASDYFCNSSTEELLEKFDTSIQGLTQAEAEARLKEYGFNEPAKKKKRTILIQFLSKFLNPLVIVLVIIGAFSLFFGEK